MRSMTHATIAGSMLQITAQILGGLYPELVYLLVVVIMKRG